MNYKLYVTGVSGCDSISAPISLSKTFLILDSFSTNSIYCENLNLRLLFFSLLFLLICVFLIQSMTFWVIYYCSTYSTFCVLVFFTNYHFLVVLCKHFLLYHCETNCFICVFCVCYICCIFESIRISWFPMWVVWGTAPRVHVNIFKFYLGCFCSVVSEKLIPFATYVCFLIWGEFSDSVFVVCSFWRGGG